MPTSHSIITGDHFPSTGLGARKLIQYVQVQSLLVLTGKQSPSVESCSVETSTQELVSQKCREVLQQ